jgi:hypothetical protein
VQRSSEEWLIAPVPVDVERVRQHAERNGLAYLGPLTNPSLPQDPHRTQCKRRGKISAERTGDVWMTTPDKRTLRGDGCRECSPIGV